MMKLRSFKKTLLLCPSKYSINNVFKDILAEISDAVIEIDYRNYVKRSEVIINTQIFRLPDAIRRKWIRYYQHKINDMILEDFQHQNPDLVFVYNNQMLLPSTVQLMKKTSKIVFFLGDNPFFTPSNNYFLTLLIMGDMVLAPDTFWVQHMQTVGIKNSFYFIPGIDESSYFFKPTEKSLTEINETEIIYCGSSYVDSWGYKKALMMSKFVNFKLEIYGDRQWKKWFHFFPEIAKFFHESKFIPTPILNAMYNKSKLMPIDGNPGILNGIHLRTFEALSAGVLPLIEYRKDIEEMIFTGLDIQLPLIKSYHMASTIAEKYLSDESYRLMTVSAMKNHVLCKYSNDKNADRILEYLRIAER